MPDIRWLTCIQPLEPAELLEQTELAELLTLRAPQATLVDKKFLQLSATGDFS